MPKSDYNSMRFGKDRQKTQDKSTPPLSDELLQSFTELNQALESALKDQNLIVKQLLVDIENILKKEHEHSQSLQQDRTTPKGP